LVAIARENHRYREVKTLDDLGDSLVSEIEQFFVNYTRLRGKRFKPLARRGPKAAMALLKAGIKRQKKNDRTR
jgi:inorganic pyrophosphatase